MAQPERAWGSTGFQQAVGSDVDKVPAFDPRTGDHLWSVVTMYRVQPTTWADSSVTPQLDLENLILVQGPFCFYCAHGWNERIASRRCKGNA